MTDFKRGRDSMVPGDLVCSSKRRISHALLCNQILMASNETVRDLSAPLAFMCESALFLDIITSYLSTRKSLKLIYTLKDEYIKVNLNFTGVHFRLSNASNVHAHSAIIFSSNTYQKVYMSKLVNMASSFRIHLWYYLVS